MINKFSPIIVINFLQIYYFANYRLNYLFAYNYIFFLTDNKDSIRIFLMILKKLIYFHITISKVFLPL